MKEYQENKMILQNVSCSILSSILNYFYSGKIEINLENAFEILFFSSKYLIDELIEISSNFIKKNFQIEITVDVLKLSDSMNLNNLMDFSYQFILDNFDEFIKTPFFLELEENHLNSILSNDEILVNEFEIFQSIIKWGKHKLNLNQEKEIEKEDKERFQIQISNIIDKIRFIDFSEQELEDILKTDLIPNQISEKLIEFQKLQSQKKKKKLNKFIQDQNQNQNSFIFKPRIRFDSQIIQEIKHFKKLKKWINDDKFFFQMKKQFSTKEDGFSTKKWHKKCDNKGKTLVIIKTKDNFIFGGFTKVGFISDKTKWREEDKNAEYGWIFDSDAFIFSLRNDKGDREPEKFTIKKNAEKFAVWYHLKSGPSFGGSFAGKDFRLYEDFQSGYSNFGISYNRPDGIEYGTNEAESYLTGSKNKWIVDEVETYFI
ncbi:pep-cterm sorting domain-containing protein [Anaeramoeba ignava]|uniref:Pep-cterm sorting domain-containing protein n=1 Tax=Anaeramoeba ignava TaxID=1746090 RepID=A0A9Q0LWA6_ANAIG|nr:pep-cterm sorting domain-containing protein [Anaeramoeba ignava]